MADLLAPLRAGRNLVLVAEPGAGKTTRLPPALLDVVRGEIVVLEPRRIAARLAARRVAEELGEEPGKRVGWQVRFERVGGKETRLRYVTEGVLVRELAARPRVEGVSVIVLDELHERHLPGDVALALARHLQITTRPDLLLVAMSATLDAERVARVLDADVVHVAGRPYEVAIEHAAQTIEKPLAERVASALGRLVARGLDGDVLVFLPGAGEIRAAEESCAELARTAGLDVVPLHGDLPADAQDRAVREGARRKVILATNVAESSVTVPSVVAVIDSGLVRVASHSPWSGMPALVTEKACRASLTQRAGRAGRVRAGVCLRLFTKADHDARPLHDAPEILRSDLAETVLALRAMGIRDIGALPWLDAPTPAHVEAAVALLTRLGALQKPIADPNQNKTRETVENQDVKRGPDQHQPEKEGKEGGTAEQTGVTEIGREMLTLPVHPRAARLALAAKERGAGPRGALLAALIGERDPLLASRFGGKRDVAPTESSDLLARTAVLEEVEALGATPQRCRSHDLDPGATSAIFRGRDQIARALGVAREPSRSLDDEDEPLRIATLLAFPDRVAKRRRDRRGEVVFAGGGAARLAETCVVRDADLCVAVDAGEQRTHVVVRLASAIEPEWLLEHFPDRIAEHDETRFEPKTERVVVSRGLAYDGLVLDASERSDVRSEAVSACLAAAARDAGLAKFVDLDALARLRARAAFVDSLSEPPTPARKTEEKEKKERVSSESLTHLLTDEVIWGLVSRCCHDAVSFAELRDARVLELVRAELPRGALDRLAPERVTMPGGQSATITYEAGKPPSIASRLQDFYGLARGPSVADGRVPLVLHLLAPNGRDVQITTDLAGFWERHYPAIRRELMRRYPRHLWAENPLMATPPAGGRRR